MRRAGDTDDDCCIGITGETSPRFHRDVKGTEELQPMAFSKSFAKC
jgi:hypothetical protein